MNLKATPVQSNYLLAYAIRTNPPILRRESQNQWAARECSIFQLGSTEISRREIRLKSSRKLEDPHYGILYTETHSFNRAAKIAS